MSGLKLTLSALLSAVCLPALAQSTASQGQIVQPVPVTSPSGTRIVLLGTAGGPVERKLRSQPASLLVVDGRPYLIDTGDGVTRQLVRAGFRPSQVNTVFLTHLHFDHTAGLAPFMAFDWSNGRQEPVEIYGPPGTQALVIAGLAYSSISEGIFTPEYPPAPSMAEVFRAHDIDLIKPAVVYKDDKIQVLAVENSHYITKHLPQRVYGRDRSYSYRVETAGRSVVFTGDTGPSDALTALAKGADVLVAEVIDLPPTLAGIRARAGDVPPAALQSLIEHMAKEHLAPDEIGKMAVKAGVKMVVLTHIVPGADDEVGTTRYTEGVSKYFHGPVFAGKDLDQF